jgi:hypothetical protein
MNELFMNILYMHPNFIPKKDSGQWILIGKLRVHPGCGIKYKTNVEATDDTTDSSTDGITTIFELFNKNQPDETYIGYTKIKLPVYINLSIFKNKNNPSAETVFDNFIKPYKLTDFTFEVKEFIDSTKLAQINSRVDFYVDGGVQEFYKLPESIENEYITTEYLYDKRMDSFFLPIAGSIRHYKPIQAYIYVISNLDTNKRYVMCSPIQYDGLLELLPQIRNQELMNDIKEKGVDQFNIIHEEEYIAKTPFDLMFRADFMKIKHAGIEGYNKKFSHEESYQFMRKNLRSSLRAQFERRFFLLVQRQIFKKNFKDIDYTSICGFIYQIKNKETGQRYISHAYNTTLFDVVNGMYKTAIKGNIKFDKMLKALGEVPFDNLDIKVIIAKKNDDVKMGLGNTAAQLVLKFDTINTGYNLDTKTAARIRRNSSRKKT